MTYFESQVSPIFSWLLAIGFMTVICTSAPSSVADQVPSNTNVIVLFADDLGSGDLGMHGGIARTPNIDCLASQSVELKRYYGYPYCSPARAALLSGQMPRRFGIAYALGPRDPGLPADLPTLPRTLQSAGYQTWLVGKWHLGIASPPLKSGFNHFYGFEGPEIDYFQHTNRRGEVDWQRNGQTVQEQGYSTFLTANEAIRLIDERNTQKPFFLQVAFNAPHFPLNAPQAYLERYKHLTKNVALRAAVLDALDEAIGRILSAVDHHGITKDTLVVFISDNGADQTGSNRPFRSGKGTVYEGGIRLPCFLRWPGHLEAGTTSQQPTTAQDLYPTIASALNIPLNADIKIDGKSVWESLCSGTVQAESTFIIAGADIALFEGDWKLIQYTNGYLSLFNLKMDPSESTDVWDQNIERGERMRKTLSEYAKEFPSITQRRGPGQNNLGPRTPSRR